MLAEASHRPLDGEADYDVLVWRFQRLRGAGYDEASASELAGRPDVDLHLAERLLRRGCPQSTALRILR
jgi:hypothetical protein